MAIIQMTRKQVEGITMSSPTNSKISFRSVPVIKIALVFMCFLITGCTTDSTNFSNFNLGNGNWFNQAKSTPKTPTPLARDPALLIDDNDIQTAIHNAVELTKQKRFVEARQILAEVRELQDPDKDGYRAVTCAMALLALREGNIRVFKRTARQLDRALGQPVNVASSYVEVISLYRVLSDQTLPVNIPKAMKRLKEQYFPLEKAKL
ncbi:MAG: hypothetical protein HOF22_12685 [Verrucomicrobia bacterium]|nr:hypothetical protein [Verrucomicrobiota bacterium]